MNADDPEKEKKKKKRADGPNRKMEEDPEFLGSLPPVEQVEEWDPNTLPDDGFSAVFFGARRSGKTFLIEEVMYRLVTEGQRKWDAAFLFSETAMANQTQYKWVSPLYKYDRVDEEVLSRIFKTQERLRHEREKEGGGTEEDKKAGHVLIIADDVISDHRIRHSAIVNKMYTQGRHYKIDVLILSQCIGGSAGLPPVVRMNADVVVVFRPRSTRDRELIAEWFLGITDSQTRGTQCERNFMRKVTEAPFTAMVVDLAKQNVNSLTDYVFSYKADEEGVPFYQVGDPRQWHGTGAEKLLR